FPKPPVAATPSSLSATNPCPRRSHSYPHTTRSKASFFACMVEWSRSTQILVGHAIFALSAVRTAWPATRSAHSFLEFCAYPLNVLPSGFRLLDGDNPADPFIAREWRNILPF